MLGDVWTINIPFRITLLSYFYPASLPPAIDDSSPVGDVGINTGIPSFFSILFIWVMAHLMKEFITFMVTVATSLSGSISASDMASGVRSSIEGAKKMASNKIKSTETYRAIDKTVRGQINKIDKNLFNSGALADKEGKAMDKFNRDRDIVKQAGLEGAKEYRRKNLAEYTKMSDSQKADALENAAKNAAKAKATEIGADYDKMMKEDAKSVWSRGGGNGGIVQMARNFYNQQKSSTRKFSDQFRNIDIHAISQDTVKKAKENAETDSDRKIIDEAIARQELLVRNDKYKPSQEKIDAAAAWLQVAGSPVTGAFGAVGGVLGGIYKGAANEYNREPRTGIGILKGFAGGIAGAVMSPINMIKGMGNAASATSIEDLKKLGDDPLLRKSQNAIENELQESREKADKDLAFKRSIAISEVIPKSMDSDEHHARNYLRINKIAESVGLNTNQRDKANKRAETELGKIRDSEFRKNIEDAQKINIREENKNLQQNISKMETEARKQKINDAAIKSFQGQMNRSYESKKKARRLYEEANESYNKSIAGDIDNSSPVVEKATPAQNVQEPPSDDTVDTPARAATPEREESITGDEAEIAGEYGEGDNRKAVLDGQERNNDKIKIKKIIIQII